MEAKQTLDVVLSSLEQNTFIISDLRERLAEEKAQSSAYLDSLVERRQEKSDALAEVAKLEKRIIELEKGIGHEQDYSQRLEDNTVGALERDL